LGPHPSASPDSTFSAYQPHSSYSEQLAAPQKTFSMAPLNSWTLLMLPLSSLTLPSAHAQTFSIHTVSCPLMIMKLPGERLLLAAWPIQKNVAAGTEEEG
jgi:hypothetical protein